MRVEVALSAAALAITASMGPAWALEIEYVGAIREGLSAPTSLVAGSDYLAVLEPYASRLLVYTPNGQVTRKVDLGGGEMGLARLSGSVYLFCDRDAKTLTAVDWQDGSQWNFSDGLDLGDPVDVIVTETEVFVLDAERREIVALDKGGSVLEHISLSVTADLLAFPSSFAIDASRETFYVLNQSTSRIQVFSRTGAFLSEFGSFGADDGSITRGGEIACDARGYVYVSDRYQGRVVVFDPNGDFATNIDPVPMGEDRLNIPTGLAADPEGFLYVASTESPRIDVYRPYEPVVPDLALAVLPVFPINHEVVPKDGLELIASVEIPGLSGVDFRMFAGTDTANVLAEGRDVLPTVSGDGSTTAEWQPETLMLPDKVYAWQVRARKNGFLGPWSELRWFVTSPTSLAFTLEQNRPNPFHAQTTVFFSVPEETPVMFAIYDLSGREVWRESRELVPAGRHRIEWAGVDSKGQRVGAGVYFYRLQAGSFQKTKKMVVVRRGL